MTADNELNDEKRLGHLKQDNENLLANVDEVVIYKSLGSCGLW